jgi:hypothetical protein
VLIDHGAHVLDWQVGLIWIKSVAFEDGKIVFGSMRTCIFSYGRIL